jgi:hypothetical protein
MQCKCKRSLWTKFVLGIQNAANMYDRFLRYQQPNSNMFHCINLRIPCSKTPKRALNFHYTCVANKKETELVPTTIPESNNKIVPRYNLHFANSNIPSLHTGQLHAGCAYYQKVEFLFFIPHPLSIFRIFLSFFRSFKRWIHFPLA